MNFWGVTNLDEYTNRASSIGGDLHIDYNGFDEKELTKILGSRTAFRIVALNINCKLQPDKLMKVATLLCASRPRLTHLGAEQGLLTIMLKRSDCALKEIEVEWETVGGWDFFVRLSESTVERLKLRLDSPIPENNYDCMRKSQLKKLVVWPAKYAIALRRQSRLNHAQFFPNLGAFTQLEELELNADYLLQPMSGGPALKDVTLCKCTIGKDFSLPPTVTQLLIHTCTISNDSHFLVDSNVVSLTVYADNIIGQVNDCLAARQMEFVYIFGSANGLSAERIANINRFIVDDALSPEEWIGNVQHALLQPNILREIEIYPKVIYPIDTPLTLSVLKGALASETCQLRRLVTRGAPIGDAYMARIVILMLHTGKKGAPINKLPDALFRLVAKALI